MISLDKSNKNAIDFVVNFIRNSWLEQNDGTYRYQNIGFAQVKNPILTFKGFFVNEQNSKCCYCCRNISNDRSTELEHIIPRSKSTTEDFQPYYVLSDILQDNVIPQTTFESATVQLNTPPFPHHVAYQNIIASCNGKTFESSENFTCCNRKRQDDFIPPFNLMQNIIIYFPDGTIVYTPELENRDYFEILNLNKPTLKNIRRLWFLFAKSQLTLVEILDNTMTSEEKISLFALENSTTLVEDLKLLETFSNPTVWNVFKEYSFFYNYYQNLN